MKWFVVVDDSKAKPGFQNVKKGFTDIDAAAKGTTKTLGTTMTQQFKAFDQGTNTMTASMKKLQQQIFQTDTSTKSFGDKLKGLTSNFSTVGIGISTTMSSAMQLGRAYRDLEDTQIAVDRTALKMSRTHEAADKAQQKLNDLIKKGVTAGAEYEQALLDVQQTQDAATLAVTMNAEAVEAQGDTYMNFAQSIIPTAIGAVSTLGATFKNFDGITSKLKLDKLTQGFSGLGNAIRGLSAMQVGMLGVAGAAGSIAIGVGVVAIPKLFELNSIMTRLRKEGFSPELQAEMDHFMASMENTDPISELILKITGLKEATVNASGEIARAGVGDSVKKFLTSTDFAKLPSGVQFQAKKMIDNITAIIGNESNWVRYRKTLDGHLRIDDKASKAFSDNSTKVLLEMVGDLQALLHNAPPLDWTHVLADGLDPIAEKYQKLIHNEDGTIKKTNELYALFKEGKLTLRSTGQALDQVSRGVLTYTAKTNEEVIIIGKEIKAMEDVDVAMAGVELAHAKLTASIGDMLTQQQEMDKYMAGPALAASKALAAAWNTSTEFINDKLDGYFEKFKTNDEKLQKLIKKDQNKIFDIFPQAKVQWKIIGKEDELTQRLQADLKTLFQKVTNNEGIIEIKPRIAIGPETDKDWDDYAQMLIDRIDDSVGKKSPEFSALRKKIKDAIASKDTGAALTKLMNDPDFIRFFNPTMEIEIAQASITALGKAIADAVTNGGKGWEVPVYYTSAENENNELDIYNKYLNPKNQPKKKKGYQGSSQGDFAYTDEFGRILDRDGNVIGIKGPSRAKKPQDFGYYAYGTDPTNPDSLQSHKPLMGVALGGGGGGGGGMMNFAQIQKDLQKTQTAFANLAIQGSNSMSILARNTGVHITTLNTYFGKTVPIVLQKSQTGLANFAIQGSNSLSILVNSAKAHVTTLNTYFGKTLPVALQKSQTSLANLANQGSNSLAILTKNMKAATLAAKNLQSAITAIKSKTVAVKVTFSGTGHISGSASGTIKVAQHGMHELLTQDTLIYAHRGEQVEIGYPNKGGSKGGSAGGGGGFGGGGYTIVEVHNHHDDRTEIKRLKSKLGTGRSVFGQ